MQQPFRIARIESQRALKCFASASKIARAFQGRTKKKSRTALRRQKLNRFAQRSNGRGGLLLHQQNPEIQGRLRHFWIEGHGALIFRARRLEVLQRGVSVRKLEVRERNFRLLRDELIE